MLAQVTSVRRARVRRAMGDTGGTRASREAFRASCNSVQGLLDKGGMGLRGGKGNKGGMGTGKGYWTRDVRPTTYGVAVELSRFEFDQSRLY